MMKAVVRLLSIAGFVWMLTSFSNVALAEEPQAALDIIDCHTHFYDPTRPQGVAWPSKDSKLYRTVLPKHLRELKQFRRVTGTVVVEASPRLEDNQWLLDLAEDDPFIVGVVGHLDPGKPDFEKHVKRFAKNRLFRGIRISASLLDDPIPDATLNDLRLLVAHDLSLDVNGGPATPAAIAKLAPQVPTLRIILNHIGNVPITSAAPPADWQAGIRAAARHPNVYCKISALVEGASRGGKQAPGSMKFYEPYIDVVWKAFGEDRVIYGSNWPVSERAADYETLQRIVLEYARDQGNDALRKFCALNAKTAYKWIDRAERVGSVPPDK